MSLIETQIAKAERRATFDVAAAIATTRDLLPQDMSASGDAQARRTFLRDSLGDTRQAEAMFERILLGNELQPINYLERGAIAARAIARIDIRSPSGARRGSGTGFLIAPQVLLTNNHVLADATTAAASKAQLSYEIDLADQAIGPVVFDLEPQRLFHTSEPLDFTVVALRDRSVDGAASLADFGFLPLLDVTGKAMEGEWLSIVQHPNGERKQLCVRENRLIKRDPDVLWYSTDTLPGSSGSPAFNNDWFVVALHHSGVPEKVNGEIKTVDGSKYIAGVTREEQIKWIANEGIRASRIAHTLKAVLPQHPLLQALFNATPASARIVRRPSAAQVSSPKSSASKELSVMTDSRTVNLPLELRVQVQPNGSVIVVGAGAPGATESFVVEEKAAAKKPAANFDAPFDEDYKKRDGFDPDFLGGGAKRILLPGLSEALEAVAAPLLPKKRDDKGLKPQDFVLKYNNYSVVMHAERRLAIYSAANVSYGQRFDMSRPKDVWRRDTRILTKYQLENWYYAANNFDRGHLTRREDLEFGKTPVVALQSAADTCHWTNCTPQHEKFNQNKEIWQGIERHVLETSILGGHFNAQIITGPVFNDGDPEYKKIPYPVQYWKVVAALTDEGNLFATAFLASQEEVIDQYGIEAAVPFGAYKTFQVKIADIERITDLKFHSGDGTTLLSRYDPLEVNPPKRRSGGVRATEAAAMRDFGRYREIRELEDIHLELKKSK